MSFLLFLLSFHTWIIQCPFLPWVSVQGSTSLPGKDPDSSLSSYIKKTLQNSLILSNLISSSCELLRNTDVLCFVCIFKFLPTKIHFPETRDLYFIVLILLSTIFGLQKLHDKFSLNASKLNPHLFS